MAPSEETGQGPGVHAPDDMHPLQLARRPARTILLVFASMLAVFLLDGGGASYAQSTAVNLVSNTEQGDDEQANYDRDHGQAFTTGFNTTGYTVTSVQMISEDAQGDDIGLKICAVDTDTNPTDDCTDLTAPSSFEMGPLTFTAPASPALALSSGTTYMVVFTTPGGETVYVDATRSNGEDASSQQDWEIRDKYRWNSSTGWKDTSGDNALRIAITGTVNAPSDTAPTAMDSTVTGTEESEYTFAATDFNFSATTTGDTLASVRILTLPAIGTFTLGDSAVTADQSVTKTQLDDGDLAYTPAADGSGTDYASFSFRVMGSTDASSSAYLMTIDVTGTQDAATGAPTFRGSAKAGLALTAVTNTIIDADGKPDTFTYQ